MSRNHSPRYLFKYRAFSDLTMSMLVEDKLFFADPATFNDPLDTKPTLHADIDNDQLEQILVQMITERTSAEMSAAAKSIGYQGPRTIEHIAQKSVKSAEQMLSEISYSATEFDFESSVAKRHLLSVHIQMELMRRYNKGVFSLAEKANCPLMWSHYGDQHRGICVGYSIPPDISADLNKVRYGGSRLVNASDIQAMLRGVADATRKVDTAVLMTKAQAWRYEREWRFLGDRGLKYSRLELEEVVFGMRCSSAVKFAIIKALTDRDRKVRFYEIREQDGRFLLDKRKADTDELLATNPRRHRTIVEAFQNLDHYKQNSES